MNFLVNGAASRRERNQWQARAQILRASGRAGTEFSQAGGKVVNTDDNVSARARIEGDVRQKPYGKSFRRSPSLLLWLASTQVEIASRMGVHRIEVGFRNRPVQ
jgi:hypothetical protein